MYIYTPLCRYWITLYRYVLVFILPHVDIELEDNKQFISNIPRTSTYFEYIFKDQHVIVLEKKAYHLEDELAEMLSPVFENKIALN